MRALLLRLSRRHASVWTIHPDIIVTELALRHHDGWELLLHLKQDVRTRHIPVVVVTADDRPSVRERAGREGCAAFVEKPCLPERLATELRRFLSRNGSNPHASTVH
jgi:CheY-like chemotaxis protein